jgi:hypothetical protein
MSSARLKIYLQIAIAIAGLLMVVLTLVVLFIPPFSLLERLSQPTGGVVTALSLANPIAVHPDGLAVVLLDDSTALEVQLDALPRDVFTQGQVGEEWRAAWGAVPGGLIVVSPVYTIRARSEFAGGISAEISLPGDAGSSETLDLYRWDETAGAWLFVPSRYDSGRQTIAFEPESLPISMAVMQLADAGQVGPAEVGMVVAEGGDIGPDLAAYIEAIIPTGLALAADGSLQGAPVGVADPGTGAYVMPLVSGDPAFAAYAESPERDTAIEALVGAASAYNGLTLDLPPGDDPAAFVGFVTTLADRLHPEGRQLAVVVRGSPPSAYDAQALGQVADRLLWAPGDNPTLYLPGGTVEAGLRELVGLVHRRKLGLLVNALNIDIVHGQARAVSRAEAMAPFGAVEPVAGYLSADALLPSGNPLALRLTGNVQSMAFDDQLGANFITYADDGGEVHYVYFGSARSLAHKLRWADRFALGYVAVEGLAYPDAPPGLAVGLQAFVQRAESDSPPPLQIRWQVIRGESEPVSQMAGNLAAVQYMWEGASEVGDYVISAELLGQSSDSLGEVRVAVAGAGGSPARPTSTPEPEETSTPSAPEQSSPPPVTGSFTGGSFELGGQTPSFAHVGDMQRAGMTWVKFQIPWEPGMDPNSAVGSIQLGHANGFKVLLSIPGKNKYPSSIDFDAYTQFLRGVAGYGPDAIEVWNEQNIDFEWPAGQIDPGMYVSRMLAPGFNAIKGVNPNIMVIAGALAPTGFDNGTNAWSDARYVQGMAAAGAGAYADCIGAHHNAGATSPSASSGHPGGGHYSWYFLPTLNVYYDGFGGSKRVCFTELGYLSGEGLGPVPSRFSWASDNTVAEQAAWLAEAAVLSASSGKVRLMIIWNVDFTTWGEDPMAGYAIVRPNGSCPACDALAAAR